MNFGKVGRGRTIQSVTVANKVSPSEGWGRRRGRWVGGPMPAVMVSVPHVSLRAQVLNPLTEWCPPCAAHARGERRAVPPALHVRPVGSARRSLPPSEPVSQWAVLTSHGCLDTQRSGVQEHLKERVLTQGRHHRVSVLRRGWDQAGPFVCVAGTVGRCSHGRRAGTLLRQLRFPHPS